MNTIQPASAPQAPKKRRLFPKWRKATWALVIWCTLILVWAIAGGGSAANECANEAGTEYLSAESAQSACEVGAGIGIILILIIGFFGFIVLSLIWLMSRPRRIEVRVVE